MIGNIAAKREGSNKRASQQLYMPPRARGEVRTKKESPAVEQVQNRPPDRPTPSSALVIELAGEDSPMRQRARDKLLREIKSNNSMGGAENSSQQDSTASSSVPSAKSNADQPLFRLKISTEDNGDLEECIIYEVNFHKYVFPSHLLFKLIYVEIIK